MPPSPLQFLNILPSQFVMVRYYRTSLNCLFCFSRSEFEEGRRKLFDLLEKVEGCSHVADVPTRYILHDGDLVEMDVSENTALHRVHGYLMNDGFMVATWLPNRRGPVR